MINSKQTHPKGCGYIEPVRQHAAVARARSSDPLAGAPCLDPPRVHPLAFCASQAPRGERPIPRRGRFFAAVHSFFARPHKRVSRSSSPINLAISSKSSHTRRGSPASRCRAVCARKLLIPIARTLRADDGGGSSGTRSEHTCSRKVSGDVYFTYFYMSRRRPRLLPRGASRLARGGGGDCRGLIDSLMDC